MHGLLALWVYRTAGRLGFSPTAAVLGAAWFLCCETNAIAVASCDTLSQVGVSLFGWLAVGSLDAALTDDELDRRRYGLSLAAFALCLLSKESGLGFAVAAALLLALVRDRPVARRLALLLPYVALAAGYWVLHSAVVPMELAMTCM